MPLTVQVVIVVVTVSSVVFVGLMIMAFVLRSYLHEFAERFRKRAGPPTGVFASSSHLADASDCLTTNILSSVPWERDLADSDAPATAGVGKPYTIFESDVEGSTELWEWNSEVSLSGIHTKAQLVTSAAFNVKIRARLTGRLGCCACR